MIDKAAMLREIQEAAEPELTVPEGWVTFEEIQEGLGCARQKAGNVMKRLVKAGTWERMDIPWHGGKLACFRKKV